MKHTKILFLFTALGASLMSGCTSSQVQKCPIDQNGYPQCSSMEEVFDYASKEGGDHLSVLPRVSTNVEDEVDVDSDEDSSSSSVQPSKPISIKSIGVSGGTVDHPYQAKPVYVPEKVHRVWFSPWQDDAKNLHSAEMIYFTTKGYWNYGTLTKAGVAGSAMMEPLEPSDVGFNPDFTEDEGSEKRRHIKPEVTLIGGGK